MQYPETFGCHFIDLFIDPCGQKCGEPSKKGLIYKMSRRHILNLILRLFLKYAYVWLVEWTYVQKYTHLSFRCEIYESQIFLNFHLN